MSITARFLAPLLLLPTLGLNAQTPERKPEQEPPPPTTAELFKRAQDKAARDNKRVLLMWTSAEGTTTKTLDEMLTRHRKLATLIRNEFVMLRADGDEGSPDRGLARRLGVEIGNDLPALSVFDKRGKLLAHQPASTWVGKGKLDPKLLSATLERLKPKPLDAEAVLKDALTASAEGGKRVFVHLGAPW
jgi:hypothetical protein